MGGRMKAGLNQRGFDVKIIPDRKWVNLSRNIKVCITTVIQDAILLVYINGHLFVNLNDAGTRGCFQLVRTISKQYQNTYLLALSGLWRCRYDQLL
jgi:hypothetical protein